MCGMSKAIALHMFVSDLNHELWSQRLPRQIFSLTPATLRRPACAGSLDHHPAHSFHGCDSSAFLRYGLRNSTSSIAFLIGKTRSDADVL